MGDEPKTETIALRVSPDVKESLEEYLKREAYRRSTPEERLTKADVLREHVRELVDDQEEIVEPSLRGRRADR